MDAPSLLDVLAPVIPPEFLVVSIQGPMTAVAPGVELGKNMEVGYHWGASRRPEENRSLHASCVKSAAAWAVEHNGDPDRISLVAFSQPCSFNYRLALDPPTGQPFRSLVALCGGIPGEWLEPGEPTRASLHTHVLHVSTTSDKFYPAEQVATYREKLASRFATVSHTLHKGGHRIPSSSFAEVREFLTRVG
jgi:predicted esterase